jgi:hypothetical protein
VTSIAIKFELPMRLPHDETEAAGLYFDAVERVARAVSLMQAYGVAPDLGRPSIACSPDLYHRVSTMQWQDVNKTVAQVFLEHHPEVAAIVAEFGPPDREIERLHTERRALAEQNMALREVLRRTRDELFKLRTIVASMTEVTT